MALGVDRWSDDCPSFALQLSIDFLAVVLLDRAATSVLRARATAAMWFARVRPTVGRVGPSHFESSFG